MARTKRNKPHNPAKVHDRRSGSPAQRGSRGRLKWTIPLALDPGDKIVALRSIRNDPLGRLHSHRQIDEAQYQGRTGVPGRLGEGRARAARGRSDTRVRRRWTGTRADYRRPAQGGAAAQPCGARTRR